MDATHIYGISKWLQEADLSRPFLYKLWTRGEGPKSIKIGRRRLITETPGEWLGRVKPS